MERVNEAGRIFYGAVFAAYQVTAFGLIRLPVRVVRRRSDGHYLTLSKLLGPKATRILSPTFRIRCADMALLIPPTCRSPECSEPISTIGKGP